MRSELYKKLSMGLILSVLLGTGLGCNVLNQVSISFLTNNPALTSTLALTNTPAPTLTKTALPTVTLAPVPTSSLTDPSAVDVTTACHSTVDGISALKKDLTFPAHLNSGDFLRHDTDFDPNNYLNVLTHLSVTPAYTLDYLYSTNGLGGVPLIYARKKDAAPFKTDVEYHEVHPKKADNEVVFTTFDRGSDFLKNIRVDGTPESYYQFVALAVLGNQFYLSWHANYNDTKILCDFNDNKYVDAEFEAFKSPTISLPQNIRDASRTIDYKPVVLIGDKSVMIRLVTFSKWGGYSEHIYTVDKQNPYQLSTIKNNLLIDYHVGIMF
jgi:hypothetical protein